MDTQPTTPVAAKKPRHRRITPELIEGIADLVAKGHSETAAVQMLNKCTVPAWFCFKARGKRSAKINDLFARTTHHRVDRLVGEIEKAATGTSGIRHDWRAAQFLAGVVDPKFSTVQQPTTTQVNVSVDEPTLRRMTELYESARVSRLRPASPVPMLPAPADEVVTPPVTTDQVVTAVHTQDGWPAGKD